MVSHGRPNTVVVINMAERCIEYSQIIYDYFVIVCMKLKFTLPIFELHILYLFFVSNHLDHLNPVLVDTSISL